MKMLSGVLLVVLYATLGLYALPEWRIGGDWNLPYSVAVVFALGLASGVEAFPGHQARPFPREWTWAASLYVASLAIGIGTSISFDLVRSAKAVLFVAAALTIVFAARKHRAQKWAAIGLAFSAGLVFLYGLFRFITGTGGDPAEHALGYLGVTYKPSTRNSDVLYFQTIFWFALAATLTTRRWFVRFAVAAVSIATFLGIVFTFARGAWVSTGLTLLVVLRRGELLRLGRLARPRVWMTGLALVVVAGVSFSLLGDHLSWGEDSGVSGEGLTEKLILRASTLTTLEEMATGNSNAERAKLLGLSFELALFHPFGVGAGNARYYLFDEGLDLNHVENTYLQLLVEQGLLGLLGYLLLIGFVVRQGSQLVWGDSGISNRWIGLALVAVTIDWSIYGLFNVLNESAWFWMVIALAGAWVHTGMREPRDEETRDKSVPRISA